MIVDVKLNEYKKIIGYYCIIKNKPLQKIACNFDETKDLSMSVKIEVPSIDNIHIDYSMVIDGAFIENKEQYEQGV